MKRVCDRIAMAAIMNLKPNSSATISYGATFGSEEFKLLEVDEGILKELLQHGLTIKGGPSDDAVLCTSSTTYAIKCVSTSNTVLLVPPADDFKSIESVGHCDASENGISVGGLCSAGVVATASGHLELVETAPRLDSLKALLNQRPYSEDHDEEQMLEEDARGRGGLYTWADLVSKVQASDGQLRLALKSLQAVEIDNYWRIVNEKFMQGLLEVLLLNVVQHDWDLQALPEADVVQILRSDGYSSQIARHCLASYGKELETNTHDQGTKFWEFDERKVCLHYAKQLLQAATKWRLGDFLEAWKNNTPTGVIPSLEMLKGEVLVEKLGPDSWIKLYSVSSLPTRPAERFTALFKERAKWDWDDLDPYLRDLQAPGQSVEAMLLKYTRKTQVSAGTPSIYTAR